MPFGAQPVDAYSKCIDSKEEPKVSSPQRSPNLDSKFNQRQCRSKSHDIFMCKLFPHYQPRHTIITHSLPTLNVNEVHERKYSIANFFFRKTHRCNILFPNGFSLLYLRKLFSTQDLTLKVDFCPLAMYVTKLLSLWPP